MALPTRSVEVEITFSTPQPSLLSSSFRTSWSIVTVTATSTFPAASGVPESRPVAGSIFSQAGPFWAAEAEDQDYLQRYRDGNNQFSPYRSPAR